MGIDTLDTFICKDHPLDAGKSLRKWLNNRIWVPMPINENVQRLVAQYKM